MSVSKVSELIGSSPTSFEDATARIVERAHRTLSGIRGIEVVEKRARIEGGAVDEYRVRVRLLFDLAPRADLHW